MSVDSKPEAFEGWAVLELMGHRRLGDFVREANVAGAAMLRIDIPGKKGEPPIATQFYAPGALYALTPCSEEAARAVAEHNKPEPVTTWEMPRALPSTTRPYERSQPGVDFEPDE